MGKRRITEQMFRDAWALSGKSPKGAAGLLGVSSRHIYTLRDEMARKYPGEAWQSETTPGTPAPERAYPAPIDESLPSGLVVVFSDAHYWPGPATVSHRALVEVLREVKPAMVIANGDVLDAASLCRQDPSGWEPKPSLREELDVMKDRLAEVENAAKGARLIRTVGNHDMRFERRLATVASEYRDIEGTRLRDHLPRWRETMGVKLNRNTMVKHRYAGGIHASYNNTLRSGWNIVTGHLHRLLVRPWGDYTGRRYGIECGTLADPDAPAFDYAENNPRDWCEGFVVMRYVAGRLLHPEICEVMDGIAWFRGAAVVTGGASGKDRKPARRPAAA